VKVGFAMRMGDKLVGNEDVWEAGLQQYQRKREQEVDDLAALSLEDVVCSPLPLGLSQSANDKERLRIQGAVRANGRTNGTQPTEEPKSFYNPKGTVGDRIKETARAGPSTESLPPKKSLKSRKSKDPRERTITCASALSVKSTLEDELLGLVEGEEDHPGGGRSRPGASSPPPYSDDEDDGFGYDHDELNAERFDPDTIVQPSGLTRAQIIAKVESKQLAGLTEQDVKAVQDEMWLREKAAEGGAPMNKDGSVRRKPGPAKGWKKLRGGIDWDERSEGTSVGESTVIGDGGGGRDRERERKETDAEIAALLGEEDDDADETFTPGGKKIKSKTQALKKRKLGSEGGLPEGSEMDYSEDDRSKPKVVGKKGKSRPTLLGSELQLDDNGSEMGNTEPQPETLPPNAQDPRGVSEAEARHRLNVVEDLEKVVWASICRDIPRVSRP
jgi:DNA helicase INO80